MPDTTICQGSKVQLRANGGLSYEWSPRSGLDNPNVANPIARPVESTQYRVVISDTCGRKTFDSLTVKVGGEPFSFNLGNDTLLCEGESIQLTPSVSDARFTWFDGATTPQYLVTKTGTYGVLAERNFCYFTDSIRLKFTELPKASLTPDTTLCLGQKVMLASPVEDGRYEWEDGSTQEKRFLTRSGVYTLIASNRCGSASSTSNVIFENCHEVFIPNIFSPNGDNINDVLVVSGSDIRRVLRFAIFSRWGNMVFTQNDFEANNALFGWTGGNVTPGVYTYFAEIEFIDGKIEIIGGDVTLMK
ncbi:MAG: hypothetical protein HC817_11145 [Saprospiraceae bacterium]|nr:hypothetical protein [Saprospiraceae bacterium]